jgi:hypothetical protein
MLAIVQLLQIARGLTTYEAMNIHKHGGSHGHGHGHGHGHAGDGLTSFITTGNTSMETAQLTSGDRGPNPVVPAHPHPHKGGCLESWKRLLGIDTFIAVALHGQGSVQARQNRANRNPFSRGILQNCADFWYDGAPIFGSRETGATKLGGERVDYTMLYEAPVSGYVPIGADEEN